MGPYALVMWDRNEKYNELNNIVEIKLQGGRDTVEKIMVVKSVGDYGSGKLTTSGIRFLNEGENWQDQ